MERYRKKISRFILFLIAILMFYSSCSLDALGWYSPSICLNSPICYVSANFFDNGKHKVLPLSRIVLEMNLVENQILSGNQKLPSKLSFYAKYMSQINIVLLVVSLLLFFLGVSLIINLRKERLYRSLKESEERYKMLLATVTDYIFTVRFSPGGNISTYHSPGCVSVTGYSYQEYRKDPFLWYKMIHPDDLYIVNKMISDISVKGVSPPVEHRIIHKDGKIRWVRNTTVVHKDEFGTVLLFDGLVKDITDVVVAEEKLVESEERFAVFMNNIPAAVFIKNSESKTIYMNQYMRELFGIEQTSNIKPEDIFDEPAGSRMKEGDLLALRGGISVRTEPFIDRSGRELIFEIRKFLIPSKQGGPLIGGIGVDITDRKKAEDEILLLNNKLEKNVEHLEEINKELESFNYTISHDLRGLVLSIHGYAQYLLKKNGNDFCKEAKNHIDIIRNDSEKMENMINDLLSLSRLGHEEFEKHELDIQEIVAGIYKDISSGLNGRKVEFVASNLPNAVGNRIMIQQVFTNLISNAIKYTGTREHARIEISGEVNGPEIVYCVRDNGVGFNMRNTSRLFKIFQRLHNDKKFTGTGVGLTIVKKIVERHGGRVWGKGEEDQGAEFYFTLPYFEK